MRRVAFLLSTLVLVLTAACGGGGDNRGDRQADGDSRQSTTASSGTDTTEETQPGGRETATSGDQDEASVDFPAAEATDTAKISMRDFVFVDMPATVTGPKLRVEAKNNGPTAHEVVVFDADGNEVGGMDPVVAGQSAVLSLELTAGTYEMRCQVPISENETHYERGMKAVFQVM